SARVRKRSNREATSTLSASSWGPLMASDERFRSRAVVVLLVLVLVACASGERRFPLRDPMFADTDQRPVRVECEERASDDDPGHVACAPEPYQSPLVWDAVDNS